MIYFVCAFIVIVNFVFWIKILRNQCLKGIHKFEAIYDERSYLPTMSKVVNAYPETIDAMKTYEKNYVKHVCRICGKTITRS